MQQEEYNTNADEQLQWLYDKINHTEIDKALVCYTWLEKRYGEIAETLGISAGNARVKMDRIKERLKKMLE